ncbi:MAG: HDIG domain-containing protein [Candidatus Delongbacteria bacterium]|nr:HDIG domain-containing protein [Candidatus Delongbacteria bacterium]
MTKLHKKISLFTALMLVISISFTVFLMPKERASEFSDYREGVLASEKITAPFDFEILRTAEELEQLREKVKSTVLPIFVENDTLNLHLYKLYLNLGNDFDRIYSLHENLSSLDEKQLNLERSKDSLLTNDPDHYFSQKNAIDSVYQLIRRNFLKEKTIFNQDYGIDFDNLSKPPILNDVPFRKRVAYFIRRNINDKYLDTPKNLIFNRHLGKFILYENGNTREYLLNDFPDVTQKKERDLDFLISVYADPDNDSLKYWNMIIDNFSKPSIIFSSSKTNEMIEKIQKEVPLAEGLMKKGDEILSRNMVVTKDHLKKIRSLDMKLKEINKVNKDSFLENIDFKNLSGKIIIASLFYIILILMLFFNRKKYIYNLKEMVKLFLIIIIQLTTVYFSLKYIDDFSPYLVTMSVTSVLIAVFFDMRVSFVATVVTSVISSLIIGNNFLFLFVPMFSGLFTMFAVHKIRDIFQFIYRSMIYSFAGLMLPAVGFYLIFNSPAEELLMIVIHSAINSAVSPLLALTILTIIEKLFKTPTDVTLLQLSDMSNPLLKKLQVEAPGTYHHTITVGNLAEAAAEAIGANSLLARVGAYYHDIGKTFKAAYFIENQQNIANKHDKMLPNMSAFILSAHVKEGVKLAREHKIPEIIIDFIRMHHGNSKMEYFYSKAVNMAKGTDEKVNESIYRYPGPKPNSKETAIVMLADVIEAKCRTESEANVDRFRQIINETILERLQSGELDECDIKINDLSKIREVMLPVITGMYHQRIKYPEKNTEKSDNETK